MSDGRNRVAELEAHLDVRTQQLDRAMRSLSIAMDENERLRIDESALERWDAAMTEKEDEIKRLRRELKATNSVFSEQIKWEQEETQKLRAAVHAMEEEAESAMKWMNLSHELMGEVERLRCALMRIEKEDIFDITMREIARKALEGKDE